MRPSYRASGSSREGFKYRAVEAIMCHKTVSTALVSAGLRDHVPDAVMGWLETSEMIPM